MSATVFNLPNHGTTKIISILKSGVDVSNITGGWKTGASWGYSHNIVSPTLNFSNGAMNITYPDKNILFGGITTQNSIDLTNYSSIEIFVKSACAIGKSYPSDGGGAAISIVVGKSYTKIDNYYVIVTRESLPTLPYSVEEIYGIRTSGRYGTLKQSYHEFYRIYGKNT